MSAPLDRQPRLQAGEQEAEQLAIPAVADTPALLLPLRRDRRQLSEALLEPLEVPVGVGANPRPRGVGAEVQERLDDSLIGDDQQHLVVGVDEVAEADVVETARHLLRVGHVEDVLPRLQQPFHHRPHGVPLLPALALDARFQELRRPREQVVG
jgi:hypothetical protein